MLKNHVFPTIYWLLEGEEMDSRLRRVLAGSETQSGSSRI